jgi:hypothetical protein
MKEPYAASSDGGGYTALSQYAQSLMVMATNASGSAQCTALTALSRTHLLGVMQEVKHSQGPEQQETAACGRRLTPKT